MPNIKQFNSEVTPQGEINSRQASGASIAPGLKDFGAGLETLGKGVTEYQSRQEIGQTMNGLSSLQTKAVKDFANLKGPMSDDGITAYMEDWDKNAQDVGAGVSTGVGAEFYDKQHAITRRSVFDALVSKNAKLQAQQDVANYQSTEQNKSVFVYNQPDPTTFKNSLDAMKETAVGLSGKTDSSTEELFKGSARKLAFANFDGTLQAKGGQYAQGIIASGMYDQYISGSDKFEMMKKAEAYDKGRQADNENLRRLKNEAQKDFDEATTKNWLKLSNEGKLSTQAIFDYRGDQGMQPSAHVQEYFLRQVELEAKNELKSGLQAPGQKAALYDKIISGKIIDLPDLMEQGQKARLKPEDVSDLSSMLDQSKSVKGQGEWNLKKRAMNDAKSALVNDTPAGPRDSVGAAKYNAFISDLNDTLQLEMSRGKDPMQLLNPQSKEYVVTNILRAHAKTPDELLSERVEKMRFEASQNAVKVVPEFKGPNPNDKPGVTTTQSAQEVAPIVKYQNGKPYQRKMVGGKVMWEAVE